MSGGEIKTPNETQIAALAAGKATLRAALDEKCELVSFLEERVHMMEGEAAGTVPAAALAGTEKALTESLAEVRVVVVVDDFVEFVAVHDDDDLARLVLSCP